MRGTVPVLATLGGWVLAGEALSPTALAGIALTVGGILGLVAGRRWAPPQMLPWARATGTIVATYATVDALGLRDAGDPLADFAWICIIFGALIAIVFRLTRRRIAIDMRSAETWKAVGGGLVSLLAYVLVVTAFSVRPASSPLCARQASCSPP